MFGCEALLKAGLYGQLSFPVAVSGLLSSADITWLPKSDAHELWTPNSVSNLFDRNSSSIFPVRNATITSNGTLDDALALVKAAQAEARARNLKLLAKPRVNVYQLGSGPDNKAARRLQKDGTVSVAVAGSTGVNGTVSVAAAAVAQALAASANVSMPATKLSVRDGGYWMASMTQNGASPLAPSGYKVWRNVKDYGAKGDGSTDDTDAINRAISDGNRCGANCGSTTVLQAVVYFPSGTYLVSRSIVAYYFTQMIGDPTNKPTIKVAPSFVGLGVISSDVYIEGGNGASWYINQNNFYRQIRNFQIDMTSGPANDAIAGIHWQVAQATSLQNIHFSMSTAAGNNQQGIFMENGSGGLMSDLTFVGGSLGAYVGNQQFTVRNLFFMNQQTRALEIHWDWGWTWKGVTIINAPVGVVMSGPDPDALGSAIFLDSSFAGTGTAIKLTAPSGKSYGKITLNLFNVRTSSVGSTVALDNGQVLLGGGIPKITAWGLGKRYDTRDGESSGVWQSGENYAKMPSVDPSLTDSVGASFFARSKPQYENLPASRFVNAKSSFGAVGDGVADDTDALNKALQSAASAGQVLWIPAGIYLVRDTVTIPPGSKVVGQAWSQIMGAGAKFSDIKHPYPVVRVGQPGSVGTVEIQDLLFTVKGATAGAIILQWNIHESSQGAAAMWDTHIRVGGAKGSDLQTSNCPKLTGRTNPNCIAASLLVHITAKASAFFENTWFWVADHDLDTPDQTQIDVYVGRGVLIESIGPVWLYGTASEHCVLYQYQTVNAGNIFMGMIQTESPYYQTAPKAPEPFSVQSSFPQDPDFSYCPPNSARCAFSWALRILNSANIYIYGAGLYSWFQQYGQDCVKSEDCQDRIFSIKDSSSVWVYSLITKAAVEMISPEGGVAVLGKDNKINYCDIIMAWMGNAGSKGPSDGGAIHRSPQSATVIPFPATTAGPTQTFTLAGAVVSQVDQTKNDGNQNAPPGPGASECARCDLCRLLTSTCCGVDGGISNPIEIGPNVPLPRSMLLPRGFIPNQAIQDQQGTVYPAGIGLPQEVIVPIGTIFRWPFIIPLGLPLSNLWSPDAQAKDNCTMYIASDFWSRPHTVTASLPCMIVLPPFPITTTTWAPPPITLSRDTTTTTISPPPYSTEFVRISRTNIDRSQPTKTIKPIPGPKPLCFKPSFQLFDIRICPPPPPDFPPPIPPITVIIPPPGVKPGPTAVDNKPTEEEEGEEEEEEGRTCPSGGDDDDDDNSGNDPYDGSDSYPGAGEANRPSDYTKEGAGIGTPRTTTESLQGRTTRVETVTGDDGQPSMRTLDPPPTQTTPPQPPKTEPTLRTPKTGPVDISCNAVFGFPRHDDISYSATRDFCRMASGKYISNAVGDDGENSWWAKNFYESDKHAYVVYVRLDISKGYAWFVDGTYCDKTLGMLGGCFLGGHASTAGLTWTITYTSFGNATEGGGPGPRDPNDPR